MPIEREVVLERIRFLRDKQRFYEGFTAIVFGLYGLSLTVGEAIYKALSIYLAIALSIYAWRKHNKVEKELVELWREAMRDPKPEKLSLPLFALIVGIPLAIVVILQLLGIVP